jgi:rubrerythrin
MRSEKTDWKGDEASLHRQLAILAAAIKVEEFGRDFYLKLSGCTRDKEGQLILKSLATDEQNHKAWLTRQIDRIFPGKEVASISPDPQYMSVIPQRVFPEMAQGTCLSAEDEIKAVEMAIEVEKASVRMYSEVAGLAMDLELKTLMQRLAQWEKGHQKVLEDNLHYLKRGGSWYGYNPILDG